MFWSKTGHNIAFLILRQFSTFLESFWKVFLGSNLLAVLLHFLKIISYIFTFTYENVVCRGIFVATVPDITEHSEIGKIWKSKRKTNYKFARNSVTFCEAWTYIYY